MKDLTTVMGGAVAKATSNTDQFAQVRASDLTTEQKGAIKYFFERLNRIYQAEYRRQLPDEATERACKAEYGGMVMDIPKEVMDRGLEALREAAGKPDNEYQFMKLPMIVELVKNGGNISGNRAGIYSTERTEEIVSYDEHGNVTGVEKRKKPLELESDMAKAKRRKTGADAIAGMLAGFE